MDRQGYMDGGVHYGLDVAQYKIHVDPGASNFDVMMKWARGMVEAWQVPVGSRNYETLLGAPEYFGVEDVGERQQYFRELFLMCLGNREAHSAMKTA